MRQTSGALEDSFTSQLFCRGPSCTPEAEGAKLDGACHPAWPLPSKSGLNRGSAAPRVARPLAHL